MAALGWWDKRLDWVGRINSWTGLVGETAGLGWWEKRLDWVGGRNGWTGLVG
jgi:hypothetical protein